MIPSFAVGRTQEMLYFLRQIKEEGLVQGHEDFIVYMDSPLAVEATGIFNKNLYECFDEEAMELVNRGINPITFHGLYLSITSEESKAINFDDRPKVILSASGKSRRRLYDTIMFQERKAAWQNYKSRRSS